MADDDEEVIDLYENKPGQWEHRLPPAFPDPRAPPTPEQPQWAREMQANTSGCLVMLVFGPLIAGLLVLLRAFF